eukprot:COSAG01_NODE_1042_length_11958_cov_10.203558_10_plen_346_part_00
MFPPHLTARLFCWCVDGAPAWAQMMFTIHELAREGSSPADCKAIQAYEGTYSDGWGARLEQEQRQANAGFTVGLVQRVVCPTLVDNFASSRARNGRSRPKLLLVVDSTNDYHSLQEAWFDPQPLPACARDSNRSVPQGTKRARSFTVEQQLVDRMLHGYMKPRIWEFRKKMPFLTSFHTDCFHFWVELSEYWHQVQKKAREKTRGTVGSDGTVGYDIVAFAETVPVCSREEVLRHVEAATVLDEHGIFVHQSGASSRAPWDALHGQEGLLTKIRDDQAPRRKARPKRSRSTFTATKRAPRKASKAKHVSAQSVACASLMFMGNFSLVDRSRADFRKQKLSIRLVS